MWIRRNQVLNGVTPELRSPILWPVITITGPITLKVGRQLLRFATPIAKGVTVTQHAVEGGQDVYVYTPARTHGGALLWIHGGGTVVGRPENDHDLCSKLARDQEIVVISTRYRLAPEHPFPAAHDDCFAALRWLHRSAGELGIDPTRIAVGGDSAGGGLAAGVVQRAVDESVPVAFQVLLYPMLDDRTTTTPSSGRGRLVWTARANAFAWQAYLGPDSQPDIPPAYASAARRDNLHGLPPTWIGIGGLDLFYEESTDYAERLKAAGVPVELVVEPGMYHAADYINFWKPSMRRFRQSMFDAVGHVVGGRQPLPPR